MKKLFSTILLMTIFMSSMITWANTPSQDPGSIPVDIEIIQIDNKDNRPRKPSLINLELTYNILDNSINIQYIGSSIGEVFIYKESVLVGYDSEINTSILLPSNKGKYEIEIITDSWIAKGYLDL